MANSNFVKLSEVWVQYTSRWLRATFVIPSPVLSIPTRTTHEMWQLLTEPVQHN